MEGWMMRLTVALLVFFLSGCAAVQDFGTSIRYNIQGEYYLQEKDYQTGLLTFGPLVESDPYNSEANYYYGRFLLANEQDKKSLPYLEKAVGLNPEKSDYHFWLGVAYGETGQDGLER
jgi:tetratricopeptide (TPR) repeat protein